MEGRLEICINNSYGSVCDRRFDHLDARVACRQLGFSTTSMTNYISLVVFTSECNVVRRCQHFASSTD